jgi:hypothetical protein
MGYRDSEIWRMRVGSQGYRRGRIGCNHGASSMVLFGTENMSPSVSSSSNQVDVMAGFRSGVVIGLDLEGTALFSRIGLTCVAILICGAGGGECCIVLLVLRAVAVAAAATFFFSASSCSATASHIW